MAHVYNHRRWIVTILLLLFSLFPGTAANYLCFTSESGHSQIGYVNYGGNTPDVQYSTDEGATWTPLGPNEIISLEHAGDKVYFRGNNPEGFSHAPNDGSTPSEIDDNACTQFRTAGSEIYASGSVMSLIDGEGVSTTIPCDYCFSHLFIYCLNLKSAPELPATSLKPYCYNHMFQSCIELTQAPELAATDLAEGCYSHMFNNCIRLTQAPELPATTLKGHCYEAMFESCGLTQAPELPATQMEEYCYSAMFRSTSITEAPALPATKLAQQCYSLMFNGCGELTKAPALPATQLAQQCYSSMFGNCKALDKAPELPATELSDGCYQGMFQWCAKLSQAPYLPATTLVKECYSAMFSGCSKLKLIKVGITSLDNDVDATSEWVSEINGSGSFVFPCGSHYDKHGSSEVPTNFTIVSSPVIVFQNPDRTVLYTNTINCGETPVYQGVNPPSAGEGTVFEGWDKELRPIDEPGIYYVTAQYENMGDIPSPNCLCFTAEGNGASLTIENIGGNDPNIEYTTNGGVTWKPLRAGEQVILPNKDSKVYVRGTNPNGFSQQEDVYTRFVTTEAIAVSGSVTSLLDGKGETTVLPNAYCFTHLFENTTITQAPSLPSVSLKEACYDHMFAGCDSLSRIPELPAMELAPSCYSYMFADCNALDSVMSLPATKLAPYCYANMFQNCKSLYSVLYELPAMYMEEGCYSGMFSGCERLETAPELPSYNLSASCYANMFYGCTRLHNVETLAADEMKENCYASMFAYCTELTQAIKMLATDLAEGCCKEMYKGCTSILSARLDGSELKKECYLEMFSGCEELKYIEVNLYTLDNDVDATLNWVDGVNQEGLFIFLCGSIYDKHGISEVPDKFIIKSSPIIIFQNPDSTILQIDTTDCETKPRYRGEKPTYGEGWVFIGWDKELVIPDMGGTYYYTAQYGKEGEVPYGPWLCFTAEEAGSAVWYTNTDNQPDVQYSIDDGNTWSPLPAGEKVTLGNIGDKVYIKGNNPDGFSHGGSTNNTHFSMSGLISGSGNVMCLIDEEGETKEIPCAHCFESLFEGCESLTQAPKLPSLTLTDSCYRNMFSHCTRLKEAPELPAYRMTIGCYSGMFSYCESLLQAPELEATIIRERCYERMFQGCTSLEQAPELISNFVEEGCYYGMFMGCTNLKEAPVIASTSLTDSCFANMFKGCVNLQYIKVEYLMSLDNTFDATKDWVEGVDKEGIFIFPCGSTYDKHGISEVPDNFEIMSSPIIIFQNPDSTELWRDTIGCHATPKYNGEEPFYQEGLSFIGWDTPFQPYHEPGVYYYTARYERFDSTENDWLCFTAETDQSMVTYRCNVTNPAAIQYSTDGGTTWSPWPQQETIILENAGDKVYVRGKNPDGIPLKDMQFLMRGSIAASGSIMSLIDGSGKTTIIPCEGCFRYMFQSCRSLTKAPKLTATTLTANCYEYMFSYCDNLTEAPELPATELADFCYMNMFESCSSIVTPPALPATKLADFCYMNMFAECNGLTSIPTLPATQLSKFCYLQMFTRCDGLTEIPELPATELDYGCCMGMFSYCPNITRVAKLPAIKLADRCYFMMFEGCSSLIQAPELPAIVLADSCYGNMFRNCGSLVQAPELPAMELKKGCYLRMFEGCNSLTQAPDLLSAELKEGCYAYMFSNCHNLNYIKVGVMSLDNGFDATREWILGVAGTGIFIFPCGSTYDKRGASQVPWEFTIISSPVAIFQNPDSTVLQQDTLDCNTIPEYRGEEPTYGEGLVFKGWDPEPTLITIPDVYYFTAVYEKEKPFDPNKCLHFIAEEAGSQIWYDNVGKVVPDVWYSLDKGETWEKLNPEEKITLENVGDTVYLKGYNPDGFNHYDTDSLYSSNKFEMTGLIAAGGSIMSLIDRTGESTVIPNEYCFSNLFNYCNSLTHAPDLPATTLAPHCYQGMFYECDGLIQAPDLPATKLAHDCYHGMFIDCGSLTKAPELPATELVENCYIYMFNGCDQLNYVKVGVMSLDNDFGATDNWVSGVDGPGTFIFPCGSKYDKHGFSEVPDNFKIVASPIVVFQNPGGAELWRDTIDCKTIPEYKGEEPYIGDDYTFVGWDNDLTVLPIPDTYYYTAIYEKKETHSITIDSAISACDSFLVKEIVYRESTSWNDTLTTSTGGDSIIAYHLILHKSVSSEENITAVGSYTWKDTTYTESTSWSDTLQTAFGCDSIVTYHLELQSIETNPIVVDKNLSACDSLLFEGVTYRESTSWNDTLTATSGTDSIVAYHLTLHKSVTTEETITAEGSYTWQGITYTESTSWNDTLQTAYGCDSIVTYHLDIQPIETDPIVVDKELSACDSFLFEGVVYRESASWNDTLTTASGADSIVSYRLILHKSVTTEENITAEGSYTWKGVTYTQDATWSDTLQTVNGCDSIVNYTLVVNEEKGPLHLTVEENLYLVLPGGSETIFYELTGGEGSKFEVRYQDRTICTGDVTNDSTVSLTCPKDLEPGEYNATLVMYDEEGNLAERTFVFNVMLPDDKQKSYYVRVWNDVVILRNGEGRFLAFQWYKERQKQEGDTLQYLTDVSILDGEYMVHVHDKDGKSYFIEPITYEPLEAAYAITAEPNVTERNVDFTVTISGVEPDDLKDARIVVYRADGIIDRVIDEVEMESSMHMKSGEYVIVLTVNDGKNANCKVLVK